MLCGWNDSLYRKGYLTDVEVVSTLFERSAIELQGPAIIDVIQVSLSHTRRNRQEAGVLVRC